MSAQCRHVMLPSARILTVIALCNPYPNHNPNSHFLCWKLPHHAVTTSAPGNVHINIFPRLFVFKLKIRMEQTDRQMRKTRIMLWLHAPHRFPRPRCCCPKSPSLPRFENLIRGNQTECACSFFPIFLDENFCLLIKNIPTEPPTRKSDASSDVSDFLVRDDRTTPRTRKSVRETTALRASLGTCSPIGHWRKNVNVSVWRT